MVRAAAARRKVRTAPAARYGAAILADGLGELRRLRLIPCFETALSAVEQGRVGPEPPTPPDMEVLRAWAGGDIRPLVQKQRAAKPGPGRATIIFDIPPKGQKGEGTFSLAISSSACSRSLPTVSKVEDRWVADETAAIASALRRKGHAVAVLEVGSLLRQNGVLDRLSRQGFTVTPPAGVE